MMRWYGLFDGVFRKFFLVCLFLQNFSRKDRNPYLRPIPIFGEKPAPLVKRNHDKDKPFSWCIGLRRTSFSSSFASSFFSSSAAPPPPPPPPGAAAGPPPPPPEPTFSSR